MYLLKQNPNSIGKVKWKKKHFHVKVKYWIILMKMDMNKSSEIMYVGIYTFFVHNVYPLSILFNEKFKMSDWIKIYKMKNSMWYNLRIQLR